MLEWLRGRDYWVRRSLAMDAVSGQLRAVWDKERDRLTESIAYAETLATILWERHYIHKAPNWKPLKGDLPGLLSQIDNMTAGMVPLEESEHNLASWMRCSLSLEKVTRLLADAVELLEGEVEGGTVKCSDTGAKIFLEECRDAIREVRDAA